MRNDTYFYSVDINETAWFMLGNGFIELPFKYSGSPFQVLCSENIKDAHYESMYLN